MDFFFEIFQQAAKMPVPTEGYIGKLAWVIIAAEGTAIAGLALYIKLLFGKLQLCQEKRVKTLEDQLALVRTAKGEVKP